MADYSPEAWDARYAWDAYHYGTEPNDFLAASSTQIPKGRVLCLCEGEGRNAVYLARQGYRVTGVDGSARGLEKARLLAARDNVTLETVVSDLSAYRIAPDTWDGIISIFAHLPRPLRARVHRDVVAGLRPGGVYVLEAYTPRQLAFGTGGPSDPDLLMELGDLRQELDGLNLVHARELERDIHEGPTHRGRSAVVQVIGVKG